MIYLISVVILLMLLFTEWAYTLSTKKKKFRHTQPDVVEQNDSEKFIDLMEIASSQVFVYLSRWNLDDIRVKKIIFYA